MKLFQLVVAQDDYIDNILILKNTLLARFYFHKK
jgi:hypothetical protein